MTGEVLDMRLDVHGSVYLTIKVHDALSGAARPGAHYGLRPGLQDAVHELIRTRWQVDLPWLDLQDSGIVKGAAR